MECLTPAWYERAVCRGHPVGTWHPCLRGETIENSYRIARAVCHRCPVRLDCLEHALTHGEPYGMWGGTTPDERRAIRRQRRGRP